jgi:hypothetical protein
VCARAQVYLDYWKQLAVVDYNISQLLFCDVIFYDAGDCLYFNDEIAGSNLWLIAGSNLWLMCLNLQERLQVKTVFGVRQEHTVQAQVMTPRLLS